VAYSPLTWLGDAVEGWRLYVFADAAHLRLRMPLVEQQSRFSLASLGVGTSFRLGSHLNGRLDLGYPLKDGPRTSKHDPRLTFHLNASY
jgi:hemolysin activation/secretion protein